eukprot:1485180-Rhodomonas_salina.2
MSVHPTPLPTRAARSLLHVSIVRHARVAAQASPGVGSGWEEGRREGDLRKDGDSLEVTSSDSVRIWVCVRE